MAQLTDSKKGPAKFVVAKGCLLVALSRLGNPNFEFVVRACVRDNFPIMDALSEAHIAKKGSEEVVVFL